MQAWLAVVIGLVAAAAIIGLMVVLRRKMWRSERVETGWEQWRSVAATLTRRDRAGVWWANFTGRAVADPSLAGFAVQRGRAMHGLVEKSSRRAPWVFRAAGASWAVAAVFAVLDHQWWRADLGMLLAAILLFLPSAQRAEGRRALRSAEANRRPAERG